MTIIIDECLPKRLIHIFEEDNAYTVPQLKLNGYKDRELLDELDKKSIDVFITIDGNIEYQQQFINRNFGTIIISSPSNRYNDLLQLKDLILQKIKIVKKGQIIHIP